MTEKTRVRLSLEVILAVIVIIGASIVWPNIRVLHLLLLFFGVVVPFILLPEKVSLTSIPRQLGFQKQKIPIQIVYGVLSAIACYLGYLILTIVFYWTVMRGSYTIEIVRLLPTYSQATPVQIIMTVLLILEIVFCEEIFFRGYLMNRLGQLIPNRYLVIFIVAMIFGVAHIPGQIEYLDSITGFYGIFVWRFLVSFIPGLFWVNFKNYTLLSTMTTHLIVNFCAYFLFQGTFIPI